MRKKGFVPGDRVIYTASRFEGEVGIIKGDCRKSWGRDGKKYWLVEWENPHRFRDVTAIYYKNIALLGRKDPDWKI